MKNNISLTILLIFSLIVIFALFACTPTDDECNHGHHAFVEWQTETTDPSVFCHDRTYFSVCSLCGEIGTKKGGMGWHEFIYDELDPTCIAEGYSKCYCTVCNYNDMYTIPIDASAHQYDDIYYSDTLYHWKECLLCDEVFSTDIHETNEEQYCKICECFVGPSIGIVYEISEDGSYATVTDYLSGNTSIEIAQYYENVPVKVIKADAFKDKNIVSVKIPNGITTIENGAFMGCTMIKTIILPDSIITIGDNAFNGCTRLRELTLAEGIVTIANGAFEGCTALKEITIPDGIEAIGDRAFYGCASVTKIDFGNTVASIGSSAFEGCSQISDVVLPDSVVSIGDSAFKNCSQLKNFNIGSGLKNVGRHAFDNCHEYLYHEGYQGKYVGGGENIFQILIEFIDKSWWETHYIIDKTKIIASGTYDQSYYLTAVMFPESVVAISDEAFADCQSLESIYYAGTAENWKNVAIGTGNDYLINATVEYDQ